MEGYNTFQTKFKLGDKVRIDNHGLDGTVVHVGRDYGGSIYIVEWRDKPEQLHSRWFRDEELTLIYAS